MFAPVPTNRLPFPWWRSRGFWFGLIGMIFLLLSWRGSFRWDSGFSYANRYWQGLRLQQRYGEVGVTWIDPCMGSGFQAWQAPLRLPREEEKEMEFLIWGMPEHHVRVRYPVLIASYVGIWLGALLWWQRRKRRMVLEIQ